jgi:hypothetical protein
MRPAGTARVDDLLPAGGEIRGSSVKVRAPWGPDVPVRFRIDVSGKVDSSSITARPPRLQRRTLWQWLRRRPLPYALPPGRT